MDGGEQAGFRSVICGLPCRCECVCCVVSSVFSVRNFDECYRGRAVWVVQRRLLSRARREGTVCRAAVGCRLGTDNLRPHYTTVPPLTGSPESRRGTAKPIVIILVLRTSSNCSAQSYLETDCEDPVLLRDKRASHRAVIAPILSEIQELSRCFISLQVSFVRHGANMAAHECARFAGMALDRFSS